MTVEFLEEFLDEDILAGATGDVRTDAELLKIISVDDICDNSIVEAAKSYVADVTSRCLQLVLFT